MGTFTPLMHIYSMKSIINKKTKAVKMNETLKTIFKALEKEKSEYQDAKNKVDEYINSDEINDVKFEKLLSRKTYYSTRVFCLEGLLKWDLRQYDNEYFEK